MNIIEHLFCAYFMEYATQASSDTPMEFTRPVSMLVGHSYILIEIDFNHSVHAVEANTCYFTFN